MIWKSPYLSLPVMQSARTDQGMLLHAWESVTRVTTLSSNTGSEDKFDTFLYSAHALCFFFVIIHALDHRSQCTWE